MAESPTILSVMAAFTGWFAGPSWDAWRALLAALFGLPLTEEQIEVYRRCTGRTEPLSQQAREAYLIIGRRGGKSLIAAFVAIVLACFRSYQDLLAPGERGVVMVIAADRRQARVVFRYLRGFLDGVPALKQLVDRETVDSIDLKNGITLEVHTASFRAVRGYTIVAAILDELAVWRTDESANPDAEILAGLRPGMATVSGALLLCISSPYARRGALWQAYKDHYGREGDTVFVWQADTRTMNPTMDERVITEAYEQDEVSAAAEYGAQFRRDIETFVSREAVEVCVVPGRRELAPVPDTAYVGFVDPSGGSQDSMTLAIAHAEEGRAVLDLIRERRPPFSPEEVVREFADVLKGYQASRISGDRYGGEWPRERFRIHGIEYQVAEKPKADLYRALLPLLNSGQVALLDQPRLVAQLGALERRTARGGRDSIDHGPNAHDDVINAAAGALVGATGEASREPLRIFGGDIPDTRSADEIQAEAEQLEQERKRSSAQHIEDEIARHGAFFPGDRPMWRRGE